MTMFDEVDENPAMGSLAWGRRPGAYSHGRLTRAEKFSVVGNLGKMAGLQLLDTVFSKLGLMKAYGEDLDGLLPPETGLVADSLAFANETLSEEIFQHSWRTYFWAMLLGRYRGLDADPEILFSAAILHDVGLALDRPVQPCNCCFAQHGAERGKKHLVSKGHDPAKARKVGEAIALHLNGYVSNRVHGAEAHLLSRGAMCDVFGLGAKRVSRETRQAVLARHPKGDLLNGLEIWPGHHLAGTRGDFLIRLNRAERRPRETLTLLKSHE